jgi:hypothetical protein
MGEGTINKPAAKGSGRESLLPADHRLANKQYVLVALEANQIFRSQVLPGFWLDVNWLVARLLPNAYQCLLEILR